MDWKEEYIAAIPTSTRSNVINAFRKIEDAEQRFGKDLALWDSDELEETLKDLITSPQQKWYITMYTGYVIWCRKKGYIADHELIRTSADVMMQRVLEERPYYSPTQIRKMIGRIRKEDQNGTLYAALVACVYWGVEDGRYDNLSCLRESDIDGTNVHIINGKDIEVPEDVAELLMEVAQVRSYSTEKQIRSMADFPFPDSIFKTSRKAKNMSTYIYKYTLQLVNTYGLDIDCIRDSGMFARVNAEAERLGYNMQMDMLDKSELTTRNTNKEIDYGRILYNLAIGKTWKQFYSCTYMWWMHATRGG